MKSAAFVTYYPQDKIVELVKCIVSQVDIVYIIDNNSSKELQDKLETLKEFDKVRLIFLKSNKGIAAAINKAGTLAIKEGATWLGIFDQDSVVEDDYVTLLFDGLEGLSEDAISMLSPAVVNERSGKEYNISHKYSTHTPHQVKFAITSGSFIKLDDFFIIGAMREELFIDYVDFDFCIRLRKKDRKILKVPNAILRHEIGNQTINNLGNFSIITTNHNSTRRYYKHRNFIYMSRLYWRVEGVWLMRNFIGLVFEVLKIIMFEKAKFIKLKAISMGWMDGLKGRYGPAGHHI